MFNDEECRFIPSLEGTRIEVIHNYLVDDDGVLQNNYYEEDKKDCNKEYEEVQFAQENGFDDDFLLDKLFECKNRLERKDEVPL